MPSCLLSCCVAPNAAVELALEWAGRGGSLRCCLQCCLHWDVALSTKPAHFFSGSKSHLCCWLLVAEAPGVSCAGCDACSESGPWARLGPCPWAAWSHGWVLAVALATQLPYKPWNAIALPVLLTLGQLAQRPLLEGWLCLWHQVLRGVLPPARARHCVSVREGAGLRSTPVWSRDPEGTVEGWSRQRRCPRAC